MVHKARVFSAHAIERMCRQGIGEREVIETIRTAPRRPAKHGRFEYGTYNPLADAMYIYVRDVRVVRTEHPDDNEVTKVEGMGPRWTRMRTDRLPDLRTSACIGVPSRLTAGD